jgi:hypothetical protein
MRQPTTEYAGLRFFSKLVLADIGEWILFARIHRWARQAQAGAVRTSNCVSHCSAWSRLVPHISVEGLSDRQTAGRSGRPNSRHRSLSSSCTQRTPAGLPRGMSGMGDVMEGAVQQAPQWSRQFMMRMLSADAHMPTANGPPSTGVAS